MISTRALGYASELTTVAYSVQHDGILITDGEYGLNDMFSANLIVIVRDGQLYVWKDRNGERGPVSFDECWARVEAAVREGRQAVLREEYCRNVPMGTNILELDEPKTV